MAAICRAIICASVAPIACWQLAGNRGHSRSNSTTDVASGI